MMDFINLDKIIAKIKEITNGTVDKPISDRGKKIGGLLKACGFSSVSRSNLTKIFSDIIGEPVESICNKNFVVGTMIVPLKEHGGHNYTMDEPCLMYSSGSLSCLRINGTAGNSLTKKISLVRKATNTEIDYFFKCFDWTCGKTSFLALLKYI